MYTNRSMFSMKLPGWGVSERLMAHVATIPDDEWERDPGPLTATEREADDAFTARLKDAG